MIDFYAVYYGLTWVFGGLYRCISAQVRWFRTGSVYATSETVKARLDQCVPCPFRESERCTQCGCPIVDKVRMNSEFCPIDKWSSVE